MKKQLLSTLLLIYCLITMNRNACAQQLSGTYTIDPQQPASVVNFQSVHSAVDTLRKYGVNGPAVFNIASGIYTGQIVIPAITGASVLNTITFQSAFSHADSVIFKYGAGRDTTIVKLDSASYIIFRFITVESTKRETGNGFGLTGQASYNKIMNCKIFTGNNGIFADSITGHKNEFSYNLIRDVISGIWLRGRSDAIHTDSNIIAYNDIQNTGDYGCYLSHTDYLTLYGNKMTASYNFGTALLFSNKALVANNSFFTNGGTCVQNSYGTGNRFYNNTIRGLAYLYYPGIADSVNEWKNNIITSSEDGGMVFSVNSNAGAKNTHDYNLYYGNGSADMLYLADNPTTLDGLKANGNDSHSVVMDPGFVSATDLHLSSGCKFGTPITGITTDILGNLRNNPPTLGAYEYTGVNDIAIDKLLQPLVVAGGVFEGPQDLVVRVKNVGTNPLASFTTNYILNNGAPVSKSWFGVLAPCDTVSVAFTGSDQINLNSRNELAVYTASPNSGIDTYTANDTLKVQLNTPLKGSYTIAHSGADFASFNEAVQTLVSAGVSGPVIINVDSGTYIEQLVIPAIVGASATNTITFQSSRMHADSVVLTFAAGKLGSLLTLDNAKYINFRYLTVTATSGRAFQLIGSASNDSISHCRIQSGGNYCIYGASLTGSRNVFSYNTFTGGTYAIYVTGVSTSVTSDSNIIHNNIIQNQSSGGFYISNHKTLIIRNNTINSSGSGMQFANHTGYLEITGNTITAATGLSIAALSATSANPAWIVNNVITGTTTGITTQGAYQRFYHNTITGNTTGITVNFNNASWSNNAWRNNIITSSGTGNAVRITSNTGTNNSWNYNLYYTKGANLFFNAATAFAAWRTGGQDKESFVYRPAFKSATDFQPNPADSACWILNGRGIHLDAPLAARDMNGNLRPVLPADGAPDLGAYEFTPAADTLAPLATVTGSIGHDLTQVFLFGEDTVARIKWDPMSPGVTVPSTIEVRQYTGVKPRLIADAGKYMYFYTDIKVPAGNYGYTLEVFYKNNWMGTVNSKAKLKMIYKGRNDAWNTSFVGSGTNATDTVRNILKVHEINDLGYFTGTDLDFPLPVNLLRLSATRSDKDVFINWSTASEFNSSSFEVERQLTNDNGQWTTVGTVKAAGNSSSIKDYRFADPAVMLNNGKVYYRLKMVDADGSYSYSKTVILSSDPLPLSGTNHSFTVYPNPFNNEVFVKLETEHIGTVMISLMDITGKTISSAVYQSVKGANIITVEQDETLKAGIYFLSVEVDGKKEVIKLVKQ